jgi:hypothetical protein
MGRITLTLKFYQVDEDTEVEDVRESVQELIESEFADWELEVELQGHDGVDCIECEEDKRMRKQHRIED